MRLMQYPRRMRKLRILPAVAPMMGARLPGVRLLRMLALVEEPKRQ
jgi:hypothetical protein